MYDHIFKGNGGGNPFHDEKGRFTTGGSGGKGGAGAGAGIGGKKPGPAVGTRQRVKFHGTGGHGAKSALRAAYPSESDILNKGGKESARIKNALTAAGFKEKGVKHYADGKETSADKGRSTTTTYTHDDGSKAEVYESVGNENSKWNSEPRAGFSVTAAGPEPYKKQKFGPVNADNPGEALAGALEKSSAYNPKNLIYTDKGTVQMNFKETVDKATQTKVRDDLHDALSKDGWFYEGGEKRDGSSRYSKDGYTAKLVVNDEQAYVDFKTPKAKKTEELLNTGGWNLRNR